MFLKVRKRGKKILACLLVTITAMSGILTNMTSVYAADGTITFNSGETISYGEYYTTKMTFDGENTAYCVEPLKKTPQPGTYEYQLLEKDSPIRKALYYLPGGYGFESNIQGYLGDWTSDDAYVIGHLVVAYLYSGGDTESAFYGAPQSYMDKAMEVMGAIDNLPGAPDTFKAFLVPGNNNQTITGSWYRQPGWIEIHKTTANSSVSDANGNYSLQGARYGIYRGADLVETLVTDEVGYAKSGELDGGYYSVKELQASAGYAIDVSAYEVSVEDGVTNTLEVTEIPQNQPMKLLLQKEDSETLEGLPQGVASLSDAEFTIKYYTEQSEDDPGASGKTAERTWVFRTDKEGKILFHKEYLISGDAFYLQVDGKTPCLPLGTVTIQETKAPKGYVINPSVFVQKIASEGTDESLNVYNAFGVPEQVCRGDLEFVKVSDGDLNRLANVPFQITSKITGESHVLVTDKNGYASTSSKWNLHTTNTNRGETASDGIWFGSAKPDNEKGALPYDTYELKELSCEANKGMNLLKFDVTIYKDGVLVQLGTLTDDRIEIATTALDRESNSHLSYADEKVTLVDTVQYSGLKKGQKYKLTGILMDKATGKPLLVNENQITAEASFTAKSTSGTVEVSFQFDGSSLNGKTVVVFETLYHEGMELAVHADIEDEDQTIYFPEIGTSVIDADTKSNLSYADKEVTLIDTVNYRNLIPGKEYQVTGILMDKETKQAASVDGKEVTSQVTFSPETAEGTIDVPFVFDGSTVKGKTLVVFETVTIGGKEIAAHKDFADEGQTVYFPEIGTTAKDSETNNNLSQADEEVTIIDTAVYNNLVPGKEYQLTGTLMDKALKNPLEVEGKPVTAKVVFTPEKSSGSIDISFVFDGTALKGKTIVAFETISYEGKEVAVHADIEDQDQTMYFPKVATTAKDGADGDQEAVADKKVTIVDTVAYETLLPGFEYRVAGTLMDKSTGKVLEVNGEPVVAQSVFTAKGAKGMIDVTFTFDGSTLANHDIVVFEKLYLLDGENEILLTSHEDIKDEGQTVKLTEIPKETPPKNDTPKQPVKASDAPKTGDSTTVAIWLVVLCAGTVTSGICLWLYRRKKKKLNKESE